MILKRTSTKNVEEFLQKNQDFFVKNPWLLEKLEFPSKIKDEGNQSKIISFKDWIIENLKNKQKSFIEIAKHNYITQKKIHESVIDIVKKKNLDDLFFYLSHELKQIFELEIISVATSDESFAKKYKQILISNKQIASIHQGNHNLIMDATDNNFGLYDNVNSKIYSNAIFSLHQELFGNPSLLIFGSKTDNFLSNKAYDLINFFSLVFENKLKSLINE